MKRMMREYVAGNRLVLATDVELRAVTAEAGEELAKLINRDGGAVQQDLLEVEVEEVQAGELRRQVAEIAFAPGSERR